MKKKISLALAGFMFLQLFGCCSLCHREKERAIPLRITEAGAVEALALSNVKTFKLHIDMEVAMK